MLRFTLRTSRSSIKNAVKSNPPRRQLSSSKLYQGGQNGGSKSMVPLYTVGACALTSASMYYYFSQRIHNDTTSSPASDEAEEHEPGIIEIVEVDAPAEVAEPSVDAFVEDVVVTDSKDNVVDEVLVVETPAAEEVAAVATVAQEAETEAEQQGAYNEETGEINWDCPCLGGMADGPCGEEFKEAFSCFVYSKEEPKGIECIEKFKNMQNCFRKYPEVYSEELRDEEELATSTNTAVMNNDIIESVEEAKEEAKEISKKIAQPAIDLYGAAQKKIDDYHKK